MDSEAHDELTPDETFLPSAPEPEEPEPAELFSSEIDALITEKRALRTVDADSWAVRRVAWDEATVSLGHVGREVRAQRLDFTVAGLAFISLVGCALLLFALMSGEQSSSTSPPLALMTPTLQSSPNTIIQSVITHCDCFVSGASCASASAGTASDAGGARERKRQPPHC